MQDASRFSFPRYVFHFWLEKQTSGIKTNSQVRI